MAGARVSRFAPSEEAPHPMPGDMLLTHRSGIVPRLIRLGERRRFRGSRRTFAHWSHAALLVDGQGALVEAETRGVELSPLSKYREREYHVVHTGEQLGDSGRGA